MIYINLVSDVWNNLYSLAGITPGQSFSIQVQSGTRLLFSDAATQPNSNDTNGIEVVEGDWLTFNATPAPTPASEVTYLPLYGSVGSGNRVSGSTDTSDTFRLLAPNSVFLIELENTSNSTNSVFFQFTWFELSSQVIL